MGDTEYQCFIGGLSWGTTDKDLEKAFHKFGRLTDAKVAMDRFSGRSRGFGFVTFDDKQGMEDAIEAMNGMDLDGRTITVEKGRPQRLGGGRDRGDRDYDRERGRDSGGGRGGGGGECFKCGKPGHFARECPSGDGSRGDRYGGRDDRYDGRDDRYGNGGGGSGRYGPDRNGDRYGGGGRSRDGSGGDRLGRDRSGPYDRHGSGGGGSR